jgi:Domain of unknown function (DUF1772)
MIAMLGSGGLFTSPEGDIPPDVESLRRVWRRFHLVRTVLAVAAFALFLLAVSFARACVRQNITSTHPLGANTGVRGQEVPAQARAGVERLRA